MTDSEYSQPQDDSDEDIYKDIPEFNFEDELAKLEGSKETYKQEANVLSEKVKVLSEENKELKKSNEVLKKNLSTLLKTAQAEVQRKDSMIQDLRTQVESFTFRRNKTTTKDKYTSTFDLEFNIRVKYEPEKHRSDIKSSKSYENQTSSDGELKPNPDEEKWKESLNSKDENTNCDNDRNSGYRKSSKTNFRHLESSHERYREKKSNRYEDFSEYRRLYRKKHRSHVQSCIDSFDKSRHSRSSGSRFLSRRRHSRERRSDHRKRDSSDGKRSEDCSERSRRRRGRSRSREISRESKESSLEKPKTRSSLDKDLIVRNKEPIHTKSEVSNGVKGSDVADNKKTRVEITEKPTVQEDGEKNKGKEKRSSKQEKRSGLDIFNTKSPLDALYNEMVTSRSSNRFSNPKAGTAYAESDFEEGELLATQPGNERLDTPESQPEEDWTLSFKNERQNEKKPMTLYSRRMLRKISSDLKAAKSPTNKEESERPVEYQKEEKIEEVEKEPGELTDDENIVESSKEFQELAKVASIEIDLNEKPAKENAIKEPIGKESPKLENMRTELPPRENQKESEKPNCGREEPSVCKEVEPNREIREVIEFSPFKNNYKLIEISPIKPSVTEHILDFYNQMAPPTQALEQVSLDSSEVVTESEKSKLSCTSDEKNSEAELRIVIPSTCESPKEKEKLCEKVVKESRKRKTDDKKPNETKKEDLGRGKQKPALKKETEKPPGADEKNHKRKRKSSDSEEGISDCKKRKLEKNEPSRKSPRNKSNSKSEPENGKPETEPELPQPEPEKKIKEDISSFEFFKPAAKSEFTPQIPVNATKFVSTTTDYKMTATMSVTGVVRLETPDKCIEKLKNLMINEHMIFNVLETKNNSQFSPLIGSKCIEMTPRRMLRNDLMLTDSEDDSVMKQNTEDGGEEEEVDEEEDEEEEEEEGEEGEEEEEEVGEEEDETSGSENSECDSDSGASDFVDLL